MDRSHEAISTGVESTVDWLDRFFVSEREEVETGESFLRVRQGLTWDDDDGWQNKTRLKLRAQLPRISKRLSIAFSDDDTLDALDQVNPTLEQELNRDERNLSIQYRVRQTDNSRLDFRYHWRSSLEPMVSGRYRYDYGLDENLLARFTQVVYWATDDGLGEESVLDLDYLLDTERVLRWRNKVHYGEETDGVEWLSEVMLARHFTSRKAWSSFVGVAGETDPDAIIKRYYLGTRYRQNFYRDWLFYEVEPGLIWKKEARGESRHFVTAITLRLEIMFGTENW